MKSGASTPLKKHLSHSQVEIGIQDAFGVSELASWGCLMLWAPLEPFALIVLFRPTPNVEDDV